jgi:hypothetical protein
MDDDDDDDSSREIISLKLIAALPVGESIADCTESLSNDCCLQFARRKRPHDVPRKKVLRRG